MTSLSSGRRLLYRICLEGNIGCGKTSVLKYIKSKYTPTNVTDMPLEPEHHLVQNWLDQGQNLIISSEPLDRWTNVGAEGQNLLGKMYQNPARWAFTFEHYSQFTRLTQMGSVVKLTQKLAQPTIHLMERSIYSNRWCFVENFAQTNGFESVEFKVLDSWFEYIRSKPETLVDQFWYLRTTPTMVRDRIERRARCEEQRISLEYLEKIHHLHEELFDGSNCHSRNGEELRLPNGSRLVAIDANLPLVEVCHRVDQCLQRVLSDSRNHSMMVKVD